MPAGRGLRVLGRYDTTRFDRSLFGALDIVCPKRLSCASPLRLAEFLAGRAMAQVAQIAMGLVPADVPIGPDRALVWPVGIKGSISHARGCCAAFVVPTASGMPGIDVERIAAGHALRSILRIALDANERGFIDAAADPATAATLTFSAKETLFKALFPTVRHSFGFDAATLVTVPTDSLVLLRLTRDLAITLPKDRIFRVSFRIEADHVVTWLVSGEHGNVI
ncbi:4'-phosphopantetheinyl transferase [Palleronia sp.]|uniref:4'-phosphopantetheinyl transferase family protein n=1 Tax=Palleronia sp. TaxID=1940284 RepID=UPI0035C87E6D